MDTIGAVLAWYRTSYSTPRTRGHDANLSAEAVNYAAEIKIRAERLLGEILHQGPKNQGNAGMGRPGLGGTQMEPPKPDTIPTLAEIGITKKQSSRAQQLAALPFEPTPQARVDTTTFPSGKVETVPTNPRSRGHDKAPQPKPERHVLVDVMQLACHVGSVRSVPSLRACQGTRQGWESHRQ